MVNPYITYMLVYRRLFTKQVQNYEEAGVCLNKLSANDPAGITDYYQAIRYQLGKGVPRNFKSAVDLYANSSRCAGQCEKSHSQKIKTLGHTVAAEVRLRLREMAVQTRVEGFEYALLALSKLHMAANEFEVATDLLSEIYPALQQSRQVDKSLVQEIFVLIALAYTEEGQFAAASELINQCSDEHKIKFCNDLLDKVNQHVDKKQYKAAREKLTNLEKFNYGPAFEKMAWVVIYANTPCSDYQKAIAYYQRAAFAALSPKHDEAIKALAGIPR